MQLYIHDKVATLTRPVKELKGFQKLMVPAGGTRTVNFTLHADDLGFYHDDLRRYWEPGDFIAYVGTNSAETISQAFTLK